MSGHSIGAGPNPVPPFRRRSRQKATHRYRSTFGKGGLASSASYSARLSGRFVRSISPSSVSR